MYKNNMATDESRHIIFTMILEFIQQSARQQTRMISCRLHHAT